ncbi:Clavaminate synthase-like protein [Chiua virens]|nr:Clavaminate synthase-like protein [Chiua virens]
MSNLSETLPVIDLDLFLAHDNTSEQVQQECKKAANALITYGALLVHDSRVSEEDNNVFLDLVEDYFAQPVQELKKDEHPEISYQVGVTLECTEKPKCAVDQPCLDIIARLDPAERPLDISGHHPDPKCRFFWKMGSPPPYETQYPALNAPNVIPQAPVFRDIWQPTMEKWGRYMKDAVENIAEMTAIGLGLPRETIKDAGKYGPHLLGPTASDLTKYGKKDTILAGFHTDLNYTLAFISGHGIPENEFPSGFPRPDAIFSYKQESRSNTSLGGLIKAGFHEVVVNEATVDTIAKRKLNHPDRPLIRISSTFFWHLSSDYDLLPLPTLIERVKTLEEAPDSEVVSLYPPMKVGQQVQNELKHIALMT